MTIGEKIKSIRKIKGLTQKALGKLAGISEGMIRQYELGLRNPKLEQLQKIANALNVSISDLLEFPNVINPLEIVAKYGEEVARDAGKMQIQVLENETNVDSKLKALSDAEDYLLYHYNRLNNLGKTKVNEYTYDLTLTEKYKKPDINGND